MVKRKIITEKDGFKLVEGTVGVIIDSIWHNEKDQVLKIKFATGKTLIFKPLDDENNITLRS
jgi:hypothetical protein